MKVLLCDTEASKDGIIRTMCLMKAEIGPNPIIHETRKYIVSDQYDFQMFFNPDQKDKFIHELVNDARPDLEIRGTFNECMNDMMMIVKRNTSHVFVSFCLRNDLDFMFKTDHLQSIKYFRRHPVSFPEDFPLSLVCAYRVLCERCPNTNVYLGGEPKRRLETYLRVLCNRQQTHFVVQDTLDLFDVLQRAWTFDHFQFPHTAYMYTEDSPKTQLRTV